MLYCLHNYDLLDKAANENPSKFAKVARYTFVYVQITALIMCVPLDAYYLDESKISVELGGDPKSLSSKYRRTHTAAGMIECICYLTSSAFLFGIIYWASNLHHRKDKIVLKTGNLNRGFICLHIIMILSACVLFIAYSTFY
jgi:hypothetical protein